MEDLLNVALLGALDFNLIEGAILHNIFQPQRRKFIRSTKYGRLNLNALTAEECVANFRFAKDHILTLANALGLPPIIANENGNGVSNVEGICALLRRLGYPNRLSDLEPLFGLSAEYLSVVVNNVMHIIDNNKGHLLTNLRNLNWLNQNKIRLYARSVAVKGAPVQNCWGFIDGTARPICRPSVHQEDYFSGHKRHHCVKYQSVLCPDGIIVSLMGPYSGRRHDAGIFRETNLYAQLEGSVAFDFNEKYVLYGNHAYPIQEFLLCPHAGRRLNVAQQNFNSRMSTVRQAVEWGFGKIITEFAFQNQKLLLQDLGTMYRTAAILTNCHTCLYGSQTSQYLNINPPTLEEYLL